MTTDHRQLGIAETLTDRRNRWMVTATAAQAEGEGRLGDGSTNLDESQSAPGSGQPERECEWKHGQIGRRAERGIAFPGYLMIGNRGSLQRICQ